MIKIFANEEKTDVYRDGLKIGFIRMSGGVDSVGYITMRANDGEPRPVVISSDKPISVTQYNTGQSDDGVTSDPFQLILTPKELYQNEIMFSTPGIKDDYGFDTNYLNLIYQGTIADSNQVPGDLEFAEVKNGNFEWKKLFLIDSVPGKPFYSVDSNKIYYAKTLVLPEDGVYKVKAERPFAAYIYGFSSFESCGYPAAAVVKDMSIVDNVPPEPKWDMDCHGNVNIYNGTEYVTDMPEDPANRSNLSLAYMHTDISSNYVFNIGSFMPCQDVRAPWSLETIDPSKEALAVVTFTDCHGNDTTVVIEYKPKGSMVSYINGEQSKSIDFGFVETDQEYQAELTLENNDDEDRTIENIYFESSNSIASNKDFYITDSDNNTNIQLPIEVPAHSSVKFYINFRTNSNDIFEDKLIIDDSFCATIGIDLKANTSYQILTTSDINFGEVELGNVITKKLLIENIGANELEIYNIEMPDITGEYNGEEFPIFSSKELEELQINYSNPLVVAPKEKRYIDIEFRPAEERTYIESIEINSNTTKNYLPVDSTAILIGTGVEPVDVEESQVHNSIEIYPNPAKDYIIIANLPNNIEKINIYDLNGKLIKSLGNLKGSLTQKMELIGYPNGTYKLELVSNSQRQILNFVVEK